VCIDALELSPISGDTNADVRTISGQTARWLKVHVTEDWLLSRPLSYTATLTPAAGVDWALFIYPGTSVPDCFATVEQASGSPPTYSTSWSDTYGSDDSRWIVLEVRHVGGTGCGADAKWTLTVQGHT
jgi:hypothetical protein